MSGFDPLALHREAIVIDAVCPLLRDKKHVDWYIEGGCTVAAPTVASMETAAVALRAIAGWKKFIAGDPRLVQVDSAAGIEAAKAAGRLGLLFHFQGTDPIEDDPDLVYAYKALGVGIIQLCYNIKNRVGDGADERTDAGLSYFGLRLIQAMNDARIIVDCSHTGVQTSLDAVEASSRPVVISHGNPRAIKDSRRNLPDHLMKAVAASGGLVGMVGFPGFVADSPRPTLDQFIDHLAYSVDLIGIDHVGLGVDYYNGQWPVMSDEQARAYYDAVVANGKWRPGTYPPPPHYYPAGIETPRTLPVLTQGLAARGFGAEDIRKVLGGNWMRVYREVWGG
ncbi:MAG: dipeptidase [Thalassobaculales bacterium]